MDPNDPLITEVKQLRAEMTRLRKELADLKYGIANCTATLTCDDPGPGGTIEITFPAPP